MTSDYQAHGLGFDIFDETEVFNHWEELNAARALATKAPLRGGLQFTFNLTIPPHNSDPRSRPVPFIPATATLPRSSSVLVQLRDGLQTEPGNLSQVWTANILGAPDTPLVLKIIQPSMCHYPPPDESWWANYTNPQDLAGHEAWAYEALQEKKGLCVPYFFGLHTIITPSGESAWVLVLEYIPGVTLDTVQPISDIQNASISGLDTIREITWAGFMLEDIRAPNFILTGPLDARAVVAIDFSHLQRISTGIDPAKVSASDEMEFFSKFAICARVYYPGIYQWAKEQLPRHVWAR
ncbi:hypothetical protein C8J57DRAFT_153367 [Mycena rebaudengoi]|nr:hypothetical protein C8J57DRAFT_153367 [Mycena rebaudengoi]